MTLDMALELGEATATVRLRGQLAAPDVPRVIEAIRRAEAARPRALHLDLAGLDYIDSAGLGLLIAQYKHFLHSAIDLRLVDVPPPIERLFRMTNLDKVLPLGAGNDDPQRQLQRHREALWESFRFSQTLLQALGEGLLGIDRAGRILFANPAVTALLGWTERDLYQRPLDELIADANKRAEWHPDALFAQPVRRQWAALRRADGGEFEAMLALVVVEWDGEPVGVLMGINDRTELEHTRAALRTTQRRLALIAATVSDGLMIFDVADQPSFVNAAMQRITGRTLAQLQTMRWVDLATPEDRPQWEAMWREALEGRTIQHRPLRLQTADGAECWCEGSAVPIMDDMGARAALLVTLRKADAERRYDDALRQVNELASALRAHHAAARDLRVALAELRRAVESGPAEGRSEAPIADPLPRLIERLQAAADRLPTDEPAPGAPAPEPVPAVDAPAAGVLVIDDEPLVRRFAAAYLERLGYWTATAATAGEALEWLEHAGVRPAVVLMDLSLPDMAARPLYERLRAAAPGARIVLSSGVDMATLTEMAEFPGVAGTLKKPYRGEMLADAIRRALAAR